MATTVVGEFSEKEKKKRKRKGNEEIDRRKFLVGDKVEVRSVEEGFCGSWHSGTVVGCGDSVREVRYDNLLNDDGNGHLTDSISVSSVIEGGIPEEGHPHPHPTRGNIRPLVVGEEVCQMGLYYGLCVDALIDDAWWEGVIFDFKDDTEKRLVFFPDLGDEVEVEITHLRMTRDWDEVKEKWNIRGSWLFLEWLEEYEEEWPISVSVQQIWYDLREMKEFPIKIKDWTYCVKSMWEEIVIEVLDNNMDLAADHLLHLIHSEKGVGSWITSKKRKQEKDSTKCLDKRTKILMDFSDCNPCVPTAETQLLISPSAKPLESSSGKHEMVPAQNVSVKQLEECNITRPVSGEPLGQLDAPLIENMERCDKNNTVQLSPHLKKVDALDEALLNNSHYSCDDLDVSVNHEEGEDQEARRIVDDAQHFNGCRNNPMCDDPIHNSLCSNLDLSHGKEEVAPVVPSVLSAKEYNPQAVFDLIAYESGTKLDSRSDITGIRLKARKHLSAHGWTSRTGGKGELCFTSPKRKVYSSLQKACKGYLEEENLSMEQIKGMVSDKETMGSSVGDKLLSPLRLCSKFVESKLPMNSQLGKTNTELSCSSQSRENGNMQHKRPMESLTRRRTGPLPHAKLLPCQPNNCVQGTSGSSQCVENLEFGNEQDERAGGNQRKRKKVSSSSLRPRRSKSALWSGRQNGNAKKFYCNGMKRCLVSQTAGFRELKKLKGSGALMEQSDQLVSYPARTLRSCRREHQVVASNPTHHFPRSVLSWLMDNNILLPRTKAHYLSRKDHHLKAEGRITRHGIKCNCCGKVYGLSSFESHAGSNSKRPSANIFLEDGRSLLDCQKQVVQSNILKGFTQQPHKRIKCNQPHKQNDYICSVCHYGGTLLLCDQCPSSFHLSCLGLEDVPKGKWFCPSCRCGICGQSEFNGNSEQFTEKTVLYCDQCRHEYHVGCIRKRGQSKLESCPQRSWFCSKKCEKIFMNLHKVLGTSIPVGVDNLSWTILKSLKDDYHGFGVSDNEAITENQMKLNVALAVMHECFEPVKEPRTKRDIVKDVLFNNISELNRLNFWGFYTVILEREDEIISVATLRIHGEKVAEIPLICTCVQYRGQGMCRILLNVLEKKLTELEVERLFLPAVPQVLQTWTGHFGFSKVEKSERLEFLQYSFLDFQDTTMCQKMLRMTLAAKSTEPRAGDELSHIEENMDMIRHNSTSEVIQAEEIEQSDRLEQLPILVAEMVLQAKKLLKSIDNEDNQQMPEEGIVQKCMLKNGDESDNQQNCDVGKCSPRSSSDKEDNIHEKCTDEKKEDNFSDVFLVYRRRRTAVCYSEAIVQRRNSLKS